MPNVKCKHALTNIGNNIYSIGGVRGNA